MSRVQLDTNILIDAYVPDRVAHEDAVAVLVLAVSAGGEHVCVCATSLNDVYYILCKQFGEGSGRAYVRDLIELLDILPVDAATCERAIASNEPDFEDGLIRAAAELNDVDVILTRDEDAFKGSLVRSMTCGEYLAITA